MYCFDRILPLLANISSRKYGAHPKITLVHATTLQEARYKQKTALGISADGYSHCTAFPIYGTGQGSGNSPTIWVFISSSLCDAFESNASGALFETPDRTLSLRLFIISFVDDASLKVNRFSDTIQPTVADLAKTAEHDCQLWNDLLWSSGGALELPKCSYHAIQF